ncbi:MAG: hypothetical protein HYR66_14170 [Sphingobacteriales bacterium]|nr:hypothetical protein [Sphingobacteriales bacterium]MBI3720550.1 hypothetical protein [Sphingobacteriales bacterium]
MKSFFQHIISLCLCVFVAINTKAQQDSTFILFKTIKADIADFTVDNLGNIFLISSTNQLKKLNSNGDSVGVFNDVRKYGKLYSVDVTNPLKMLLYYKNFVTIVVLDRFLNIQNTIDLRKQNIFSVKAVGQSFDNNIWIFDEQNARLKRIGEDGKVMNETVDFRLLFDSIPSPAQIFDQDRYVYLYDSTKGMFIFDYYGSLKNNLHYTGLKNVQVIGKTIFGVKNNQFFSYTMGDIQEKLFSLPAKDSEAQKMLINSTGLYILNNNELRVYRFR